MKAVEQLQHRVARFSKGLTRCTAEASVYGKCIAAKRNLKKDDCLKEFNLLRECVTKSMKK